MQVGFAKIRAKSSLYSRESEGKGEVEREVVEEWEGEGEGKREK